MKTPIDDIFKSFSHGVCHRGLHDLQRPENSRASFEYAIENGFPFECDVNLTKDNRFVVNHDGDLLRVTGKEGNIKDLTVEEIQSNYKLFDGSSLITLEELLQLWDYKVPLVLEIKVQGNQVDDIVKYLKPTLMNLRDKSKIVLISFNSEVLLGLKDTEINVGRLYGKHEIFSNFVDPSPFDFMDVYVWFTGLRSFRKARKNGKKILTWTVIDKKTTRYTYRHADAMTFEIINSSKSLVGQKENKYLLDHIQKYSTKQR